MFDRDGIALWNRHCVWGLLLTIVEFLELFLRYFCVDFGIVVGFYRVILVDRRCSYLRDDTMLVYYVNLKRYLGKW